MLLRAFRIRLALGRFSLMVRSWLPGVARHAPRFRAVQATPYPDKMRLLFNYAFRLAQPLTSVNPEIVVVSTMFGNTATLAADISRLFVFKLRALLCTFPCYNIRNNDRRAGCESRY